MSTHDCHSSSRVDIGNSELNLPMGTATRGGVGAAGAAGLDSATAAAVCLQTGLVGGGGGGEEGPSTQLNGGSDPVLITVSHSLCRKRPRTGVDDLDMQLVGAGFTTRVASVGGGWSGGEGSRGRVGALGGPRSGGVRLSVRVKAYNATNARLHGFVIRLGFGRGAEVFGLGHGGRVESHVEEVLMPAAAHTVEIPLQDIVDLKDVVVQVSVAFMHAEPEPEFEREGTAELLGGEAAVSVSALKAKPGVSGGWSRAEDDFRGGSVQVTVPAGSYRIPAEDLLLPPPEALRTLAGFQTLWCRLPFLHAIPVSSEPSLEAFCQTAQDLGLAMETLCGLSEEDVAAVSATDERGVSVGARGVGGHGWCDVRTEARVQSCPGNISDYVASAAWAFETPEGGSILAVLSVIKTPLGTVTGPYNNTSLVAGAVGGGGKGGGVHSWVGRLEVRCGSVASYSFARAAPGRLTRFITNEVFTPAWVSGDEPHQNMSAGG
ncbi:unnamed protein product, partial [Choristocarpus tenellus]